MRQINPQILQEWKKKGEILCIFGCERCYRKTVFYKSNNPIVDTIHQLSAKNRKYCFQCESKLKKNVKIKKEVPRINFLLEMYEPYREPFLETFKNNDSFDTLPHGILV